MALTREYINSEPVLTGTLADNTPDNAPTCGRGYGGYGCTLGTHSDRYPHLAGDGESIVALWWEGERRNALCDSGQ